MKNSKVSVIVPVYNCEKYLETCIKSLVNQTYKNLELIFINDGSSDKSLEILNKHTDEIKIINQENMGSSTARNNGIKNSTGEYIMFVDGDDFIENNSIEIMLKNAYTENADVVRCNRKDISKDKHITNIKPLYTEKKVFNKSEFKDTIYKEIFTRGKLNSMCMTLIKNSLVKENRLLFDEKLACDEDIAFAMQLYDLIERFVYIPDALYNYVRHGNGLSGKGIDSFRRSESRIKRIEDYSKFYYNKWGFENYNLLNDNIAFITIYTAFQISKFNSKGRFSEKFNNYKRILTKYNFEIKKSSNKMLKIHEKILAFLVKHKMFYTGYIYGETVSIMINCIKKL